MNRTLLPTSKNISICEFNKKIVTNCYQLLHILIKSIESQKFTTLIDRQKIFKNQSYCFCRWRVAGLSESNSFNVSQPAKPKLSGGDEVSICKIGYFKCIVILADKGKVSLLNWNITFVRFCFKIMNEYSFFRDNNKQIFEYRYLEDFKETLQLINIPFVQKVSIN